MCLSVVQCEVLLSQSMRFFGKREQANLAIQLAQPLTVPLGLFELPEQEYCTSAETLLNFWNLKPHRAYWCVSSVVLPGVVDGI